MRIGSPTQEISTMPLKRRWQTWLILGILLIGLSFLLPPVRWCMIGWVRSEAFFEGRPTSYWSREVAEIEPEFEGDIWSCPVRGPRNAYGGDGQMTFWDEIKETIGIGYPPAALSGWQLLGGEPGGGTDPEGIWFFIQRTTDPAAIPVLRELVKDQNAFVRFVALDYLHTAGADDVSMLTEALHDSDREVRLLAALTLADRPPEERPLIVSILIEGLKHDSSWAQSAAVRALAGLGQAAKPVAPELTELLKWKGIKFADGRDAADLAADALKRIDPEAAAKAGIK
jgi:hypothetical protein